MSKLPQIVLIAITFLLTTCVGFLAWQVNELRLQTLASLGQNSADQCTTDDIKKINNELGQQKTTVSTLAAKLASLPADLRVELAREFLKIPSPVLDKAIFSTTATNAETFTVTGNKTAYVHWLDRNATFWEYLRSKSGRIIKTATGLELSAIPPLSLLDQIGFKAGDVVTALNGSTLSSQEMLWETLTAAKPATFKVNRAKSKLTFVLNFTEPLSQSIELEMTVMAYRKALDTLHVGLQMMPAMVEGKNRGVHLVNVEPTNPLALLGFKNGDILTAVANSPITTETFAKALLEAAPFIIHYTRDEKPESLMVKFAE